MRAGLATSLVLHSVIAAVGILSATSGSELVPEVVESIPVQLVTFEEFATISRGALDQEIIETDSPSPVENDEAPLPEVQAGNTELEPTKPNVAEIESETATEESAPEPVAADVPDPVRVIEPAAPSQPATDVSKVPEPAPRPIVVAKVDPVEEPLVSPQVEVNAPVPPPVDQDVTALRAAFKKKKAEDAERRQEELAKAKEADQISDIINSETSRGGTTGSGGQQTAGSLSGRDATLSASEIDYLSSKLHACWQVPPGALDEQGLVIKVFVELNVDGTVKGIPRIMNAENLVTGVAQRTGQAAIAGILDCAPYVLPSEKYELWGVLDVDLLPQLAQ